MFSLYQTLLDVLEKGEVFFADELDIKFYEKYTVDIYR